MAATEQGHHASRSFIDHDGQFHANGAPMHNDSMSVAAGSALSLTVTSHDGKTINLDTLTGSTVTLPAATGSGARFRFVISVLATSNSHVIITSPLTDFMQGIIMTMSDDAGAPVKAYAGQATTNTITLNRTTTGCVSLGEVIEVDDFAAGMWQVFGFTSSTGTEATPFSHT